MQVANIIKFYFLNYSTVILQLSGHSFSIAIITALLEYFIPDVCSIKVIELYKLTNGL